MAIVIVNTGSLPVNVQNVILTVRVGKNRPSVILANHDAVEWKYDLPKELTHGQSWSSSYFIEPLDEPWKRVNNLLQFRSLRVDVYTTTRKFRARPPLKLSLQLWREVRATKIRTKAVRRAALKRDD